VSFCLAPLADSPVEPNLMVERDPKPDLCLARTL
jgi:hypothetical protein